MTRPHVMTAVRRDRPPRHTTCPTVMTSSRLTCPTTTVMTRPALESCACRSLTLAGVPLPAGLLVHARAPFRTVEPDHASKRLRVSARELSARVEVSGAR